MATSYAAKKASFLQRSQSAFALLLAANDALSLIATEAGNNFYLSGANVLTDAEVQATIPSATAAQVFQAFGALSNSNQILATIAANRQILEVLRP